MPDVVPMRDADRLYDTLALVDTRGISPEPLMARWPLVEAIVQAAREGYERSQPGMEERTAWDNHDRLMERYRSQMTAASDDGQPTLAARQAARQAVAEHGRFADVALRAAHSPDLGPERSVSVREVVEFLDTIGIDHPDAARKVAAHFADVADDVAFHAEFRTGRRDENAA